MIRRVPFWRRRRIAKVIRLIRAQATFFALILGGFLGFGISSYAMVGTNQRDWTFVLVLITAAYVILTYLLLRTSTRQAAAAEHNIALLRQQLASDQQRRSGPIAVLAREVQHNIHAWEAALKASVPSVPELEGGDRAVSLPPLLPDNFEEVRNLSATVDLYYHQELTSVRMLTSRASDKLAVACADPSSCDATEAALAAVRSDLRSARDRLQSIVSNIHGWDNEEQQ